jgi:hypothetical protein
MWQVAAERRCGHQCISVFFGWVGRTRACLNRRARAESGVRVFEKRTGRSYQRLEILLLGYVDEEMPTRKEMTAMGAGSRSGNCLREAIRRLLSEKQTRCRRRLGGSDKLRCSQSTPPSLSVTLVLGIALARGKALMIDAARDNEAGRPASQYNARTRVLSRRGLGPHRLRNFVICNHFVAKSLSIIAPCN